MIAKEFISEIEEFWQKVCYFSGQLASFAREVKADPSMLVRADLIMICAALLVVVLFFIGGLIRFFTEPWKKKAEILLVTLIIIVLAVVAAFFLLRFVPLPTKRG